MYFLSEKELEVLKYLVRGLNNKEIADLLFITIDTVKAHITSIFRKLNVKNRTAAAYVAIKNNLVEW